MSRFLFARFLAASMCCLVAVAGSNPTGQEKQTSPNADKPAVQEEKAPPRGMIGGKPQRAKAATVADRNEAFLREFKNLHKHELHFMRRVCQPSRELFERIAADSEPAILEQQQKFIGALEDGRVRMRGGFGGVAIGTEDAPEPSRQVAEAVAKSVRKILPVQLAERYDKELAERLDESRRTQVQGYVVKMDILLQLSVDQREALTKLLLSTWSYSASRTALLDSSNPMYPTMPDAKIDAVLTEPQRQVWAGARKGIVGFNAKIELGPDSVFEEIWDTPAIKPVAPVSKAESKPSGPEKKERR